MDAKLLLYSLLVWFIFVAAAIGNGILRESLIRPRVGAYAGHVISTFILMAVILGVTYVFISSLKIPYSTGDLLLIGGYWLLLTVAFEFIFGHFVVGHSWSTLLADYNILKGRLWSFVLAATFLAPWLAGSVFKK